MTGVNARVNEGHGPPQFKIANPAFESRIRDSFARQRFMEHIGAQLVTVEPGYCVIRLPYEESLTQQHEFFHGGVIGTIADNAGGYAAFTLAAPDASVLTVEYKLNLLSPGQGEALEARGRVIRPGRSLVVSHSEVYAIDGGSEKLVAVAIVTLTLLPDRTDGPANQEQNT
ncbi:MAG: PaaI family thioesterase [Rhodospirillaceae bacterium]|jgi:uncharacterized protein (TIGR00369 family)|nr:PaaI family thioesterase [Rhodospirillaceae bacterium]MBT6137494.1 PaaI family thioesterase [Rhodospirillaceae bacterium]